jgi:ABC transporter with metal-binding/Fe-S-binding domain ATP-binding protein
MRLAALFSGGKDSTFALLKAMKQGHEIKYLVTLFPQREDSWMFHYPCVEQTRLQSKALGIRQIIQKTAGEKEKELDDLRKVLIKIKPKIDGIVSGAVASKYQKNRIDKICEELGLESIAPLWGRNQEELLNEEIRSGLDIIITSVSTAGLDKSWLGKRIDAMVIDELKQLHEKYGLNLVFEGGEAETLVCDAPIFKKRIEIQDFKTLWDNRTSSGYIKIGKAVLVDKY